MRGLFSKFILVVSAFPQRSPWALLLLSLSEDPRERMHQTRYSMGDWEDFIHSFIHSLHQFVMRALSQAPAGFWGHSSEKDTHSTPGDGHGPGWSLTPP